MDRKSMDRPDRSDEIFFPRFELKPHLDQIGIVWTRGGKLSAQGERVGHLTNGTRDGIAVSQNRLRLNGELRMFESAGHLERDVRSAFDQAFQAVLCDRAEAEALKRERADTSMSAEFRRAWRDLREIITESWERISATMVRNSQVQENHGQEQEN